MKNALVVDDTKLNRVLITKCLEGENYTVQTASRGNQAIEILQTESFNLIFLDIKMPFLSGTEVLKTIRQNGINTPVIIVTAYATVKNAIECTKLGAVAYLQKPFTIEKLKNTLHEVEALNAVQPFLGVAVQNSKNWDYTKIQKDINDHAELALSYLTAAMAEDPTNADLYLLLSKVYQKLGQTELSVKFSKMSKILKN